MDITRELIRTLAPDSGSISDGEGLVRKNKFSALHKDSAETIIFGECAGSGKNPYRVSVDFINPAAPVSRCSCPSRKFPCKHAIGLMIAYADGNAFTVADIPEDIQSKREKAEKRTQKKDEEIKEAISRASAPDHSTKARKAAPKKNSAAQEKKLTIQIDGLTNAENLLFSLVRNGFGSITTGTITEIEKQAKQMGDYYLTGVQKQLLDFAAILKMPDKEAMYSAAYDKATFLHALIKKGKEYLSAKLENPALLDITSEIEALLGNIWKSKDLLDAGLAEADVRLIQLAFTVNENNIINETDEMGFWMNLANGDIVTTHTIIPKKAKKYINATDSVYGVLSLPVMYRYPGALNYRVRWDEQTLTSATTADYTKVISLAASDLPTAVRQVKEHMKAPLAGKNPVMLVTYKAIGSVEGKAVLEDVSGNRIGLVNAGEDGWLDTLFTIEALGREVTRFSACLLRFKYIQEEGQLAATPLTLVSNEKLLRLSF